MSGSRQKGFGLGDVSGSPVNSVLERGRVFEGVAGVDAITRARYVLPSAVAIRRATARSPRSVGLRVRTLLVTASRVAGSSPRMK